MDRLPVSSVPGNNIYGQFTHDKSSHLSPPAVKLPTCERSPGICETPVRERRLSRIIENEVCSPRTRPPALGELSLANLPIHTTPPSRMTNFEVQNPFDESLRKNLHLPFISPTLFTKTISPSKDSENFSWSIEDLANLFPAEIDEHQPQTDQLCDEKTEQEVQHSICRFFESNIIVPSPWATFEPCKSAPIQDLPDTPVKAIKYEDHNFPGIVEETENLTTSVKKEAWAQTELTFPGDCPILLDSVNIKTVPETPEKKEKIVHPENTLPRNEPISSSPCYNPYKNLLSSSTIYTPKSKTMTRNFGTPLGCSMSPIGLSPIVQTFQHVSMNFQCSKESVESLCSSCNKYDPSLDSGVASTMSQTDVAFPSILPESVEEILKPYHNFVEEQSEIDETGETNLNSSMSRRRKLLFHETTDMSLSSIDLDDNGYESV